MNSNDPMKDNSSGHDRDTYGYRPSDGQGYVNPDGSHGYVYFPEHSLSERQKRRYRGAVIILSVVLVTVLALVCCLAGAYLAIFNADDHRPYADGQEKESSIGTSEGLVIGSGVLRKLRTR